jgi:ABC transporter substrate binding protein
MPIVGIGALLPDEIASGSRKSESGDIADHVLQSLSFRSASNFALVLSFGIRSMRMRHDLCRSCYLVDAAAICFKNLATKSSRSAAIKPTNFALGLVTSASSLAANTETLWILKLTSTALYRITDTNDRRRGGSSLYTPEVVFVLVPDPIGSGLVESLARPGGNATGLSLMAVDLSGKRLELLKQAVPTLSRVALLTDPKTDPSREHTIKASAL